MTQGAIGSEPPTGTTYTSTRVLGGLPEDYVSPPDFSNLSRVADRAEQGVGIRPGQPARYRDGAQFAYINAGPEMIWRMQQRLFRAGLLTDDDLVSRGVWRGATVDAYEYVLGYANAAGVSDLEALAQFEQTPLPAPSTGGRSRQPLVRQVTNDDDLRAVFRAAAKETLGYGAIPDEHVARLVKAYQQEEIRAQEAAYAADATGGTVAAPPSLDVFAAERVREIDPVAADANKVVGYVDLLVDLMRGGS